MPIMKKFLTIILFAIAMLHSSALCAQNRRDEIVMPQYPGGERALHEYILSELTYPAEAMRNNEVGEVLIGFSVGMDGSVSGVRVLRSVSESLDAEAVRVVKKMRYWTPGKRNGRPVRAEMSIPINFKVVHSNRYIDDDEVGRNGSSDDERNRVLY